MSQSDPWQQPPAPQSPGQVQSYPQGQQPYPPRMPSPALPVRYGLTAAQKFWYILGCIPLAAAYFAKVPAKKAMHDAGLCELTGAEAFWYILSCVFFGAGYFAKLPVAKALSELPQFRRA